MLHVQARQHALEGDLRRLAVTHPVPIINGAPLLQQVNKRALCRRTKPD